MRLTSCTSPAEFQRRVEPFLVQHEAENNLILGIVSGLVRGPELYAQPP